MSGMAISEVARRAGVRPSTLRYYEHVGILPPPHRSSGQRRYDATVLNRLAVIERARQTGFTLGEIKQLFFGFRDDVAASDRWRRLSAKKLVELEELTVRVAAMQHVLRRMQKNCRCATLDQCGKAMLDAGAPARK
jgi:MerR family transcriptional regulator, redox-sensitive transcriptional activator SoxR